jgi:carboxyl-terminal processing protease
MPLGLEKRVFAISETVLRHHLDPPTRQQMVLDGIHELYRFAERPVPAGLSRRVSSLTTPEQFAALLMEVWPSKPMKARSGPEMEQSLISGLLASVPGGAQWLSAKEYKVEEQLQGNRYVGIHIQLGYDDNEKRAVIQGIVPGGPADRAGARKEDRIESIDAVDTRNMKLAEIVDRLRGESGTELVVQVRQPRTKESRTLKMTRGPLFLPTISGLFRRSSGEWDYRASESPAIAYLRIRDISASTTHELRRHEGELRGRGFRALVIDLREVTSTSLHPAVLLADSLLDHGRIGQVRQADGVATFDATPGSLFPDWPLAILIDEETTGAAAWLAAALQDNHRAVLIGTAATGAQPRRERTLARKPVAAVWSTVPIGEDATHGYLSLVTGHFERADGRDLAVTDSSSTTDPTISKGRSAGRESTKSGLTPDYSVRRQNRAQTPRAGTMLGDAAPAADPWADAVLSEAVKRLAASRSSF